MSRLPGPLYKELIDALISAFPTYEKLEQMTRFELDENLAVIAGSRNLYDICFKLINWAETNEKVGNLIRGARKSNPNNLDLVRFEEKYKNIEPDRQIIQEKIPVENLEEIIKRDNIQSISLILDFSISPIGIVYSILGRSIYLASLPYDTEKSRNDSCNYGHLNIYLPIHDFHIAESFSEEDEIFTCGLINYIANHASIVRFSIEKFGKIPEFLKYFGDLEELRILDCKNVDSVPSDVVNLLHLRRLVINNTSIDSLPSSLFRLTNLITLDLANNQLQSIPPEICQLTTLSFLDISNNKLDALPFELEQLKNIRYYSTLGNPFKNIQEAQKYTTGDRQTKQINIGLNSKKTQLQKVLVGLFVTLPKFIGRFLFDIFGQHEPAVSSTIFLGWLIIVVVILILSSVLTLDLLVSVFQEVWRFLFSAK